MEICKVCGKEFKRVTIQHIRKHNIISFKEYNEKYPIDINNEELNKSPEVEDLFNDKNNTVFEELKDNTFEEMEEIKVLKDETIKNKPIMDTFVKLDHNPDKSQILGYIKEKYPNAINNYFIKSKSGTLYITDICVPNKRLIFDFPDSIWHNQDMHELCNKESRDKILKSEGWKIIRINSKMPKVNDLIGKF